MPPDVMPGKQSIQDGFFRRRKKHEIVKLLTLTTRLQEIKERKEVVKKSED